MDDEDDMLTTDGELYTRHWRRNMSTHREKQRTRSKQQDAHEERTKGKQGRAHTTTTSSKILEIVQTETRGQTLSDSGWIKMSLIMDSGAAESAAQVGRECVARRRSTRPLPGGRPPGWRISGRVGGCGCLLSLPVASCRDLRFPQRSVLRCLAVRPARRHHARVPRSY